MVRVSEQTRDRLRELATKDNESLQTVVDRAVEDYRRRRILEETNAAYAALRADPVDWQAELDERRLWDSTLMDGLDPDEHWEALGAKGAVTPRA